MATTWTLAAILQMKIEAIDLRANSTSVAQDQSDEVSVVASTRHYLAGWHSAGDRWHGRRWRTRYGFNDLGVGQPVHVAELWDPDPAKEKWAELTA